MEWKWKEQTYHSKPKTKLVCSINQNNNTTLTPQCKEEKYRLVYMADFLESIKCKVDHGQRYKLLHPNICSMVRKLKLNRKKTRRGNKSKHPTPDQVQSLNLDNLIKIKCTRSKHIHNITTKLKLTAINIQALKSKELTLIEHLGSNDADMCIVTETWLNEDDQVWLQSSEFSKNGWKCHNINRRGRWGRGLALIYHDRYQTKCWEQGAIQSFEYGIWQVRSSKTTNVIIAIYHPPYSDANPVNNSMFIDNFTD